MVVFCARPISAEEKEEEDSSSKMERRWGSGAAATLVGCGWFLEGSFSSFFASGLPRPLRNLGRNGDRDFFSARVVGEAAGAANGSALGIGDLGDFGKAGDRGVRDRGVWNRGDLGDMGDFVPSVEIDRRLP